MSHRIYTRSGDTGETGLFGGLRVSKDDLRIEAIGTIDELNALLGTAQSSDEEISELLLKMQNDLFQIGADLAAPRPSDTARGSIRIVRLEQRRIDYLENLIDQYEDELQPLTRFILPGGDTLAAQLHLCRVVCRRAERRCVTLANAETGDNPLNPEILRYLNRLSDLLFVLARVVNHRNGIPDIPWNP